MKLQYETKVVGTGSLKIVVIGKIVQGAELLTGTGIDASVMSSPNKILAEKNVPSLLKKLDPRFSGTGNIYIGDLDTNVVNGVTKSGYSYSGRTIEIPLKVDPYGT